MPGKAILLVDDEESCLQIFSDILRHLGYTVRDVASGQAAIEAFSRDPDAFSLVLLDQIMPGLTGFETARQLRDVRGDVPIALLTGWFLNDEMKRYAKTVGIRRILEKPITVQQLNRSIRNMICTASCP